jgi:hypothetical protein
MMQKLLRRKPVPVKKWFSLDKFVLTTPSKLAQLAPIGDISEDISVSIRIVNDKMASEYHGKVLAKIGVSGQILTEELPQMRSILDALNKSLSSPPKMKANKRK